MHPVSGTAYWDEFAPIKDEWGYDEQAGRRKPTGKKAVDGNWKKMPRLMIEKCAEAQALRAGWPDSFSGLYVEEEMDQAREKMRDVTPSEAVREEAMNDRISKVGDRTLLAAMDEQGTLDRIKVGEFADRALEYIANHEPHEVHAWRIRNTEAMRDFWALAPTDALDLKAVIEKKEAQMAREVA